MQNLELNTFEYEEDTELGTLQIEQVENGTKIMIEFFPNNQSKESFEKAEFSEVCDILELAPLTFSTGIRRNFSKIYPTGITQAQEYEIDNAIINGVSAMLETILNLQDFKGTKITSYTKGEIEIYPILETLRKEFLIREITSFIQYRSTEAVELLENTKIEVLEEMYRVIDTINETNETRTKNLKAIMEK